MTFDLDKIAASKRAMREKLRTLPIAEKLRLLDAMHEREIAIRGARPLPKQSAADQQVDLLPHNSENQPQ